MSEFASVLNRLIGGQDLARDEMHDLMMQIMTGKLEQAQIAAVLIALRIKGESVDELTAAAEVMRELAAKVNTTATNLIDIVGTGGDGQNTFNISTATCFVAAACGAKVAKHGNRSVSSKSGSADLLEHAGVNINLSAEQVNHCIEQCGLGFMFAPVHHQAMKHAIDVRRALGVRTLFNKLGPLTNPANAQNHLIGVYDKALLAPFAQVLKNLGCKHAMIIHSQDGLDEISISAQSDGVMLIGEEIKTFSLSPQDYDCYHDSLDAIRVSNTEQSYQMMLGAFEGKQGAAYDIIALNAGAALYCANLCDSMQKGIDTAKLAMKNGDALEKLTQLVSITQAM